MSADVAIRTLRMRVPAGSAAEGEALARAALQAAAAQLAPDGPARAIGALSLSVRHGAGVEPAHLGSRIAEGLQ